MAETNGGVISYICDNGLIDFAVPISVNNQIIGHGSET
jgi:ligand-binding sensor protein